MEWLESRRVLASTFGHEWIDLPIENSGVAMEVADLNGDSLDDLIIGTGVGTVEVLLNNGDASFSNVQSLPVGGLVHSLTLADLDGDNRATDLFVHTANGITPMLDQGIADDVWQGYRAGDSIEQPNIYRVEAAQLNGDAFADIVYGLGDSVIIQIGQGDLAFGEVLLWELGGIGENDFDVGDVNEDGFDDIVATTPSFRLGMYGDIFPEGPIIVLTNDQDGSFLESHEFQGDAQFIELFDFNADGTLDIFAAKPAYAVSVNSRLYLGNGNGIFAHAFEDRVRVPGHFRVQSNSGLRAYSYETQGGHSALTVPGGLFVERYDTTTDQATNVSGIGIEPWRSGSKPYFARFHSNDREQIIGLAETSLAVVTEKEASVILSTEDFQLNEPNTVGHIDVDDFNGDGSWTSHPEISGIFSEMNCGCDGAVQLD